MSVTEASRRIPRPHHNFVPEYQMSGIPHVETRELVDADLIGDDGNVAVNGDADASISNIASFKFEFKSNLSSQKPKIKIANNVNIKYSKFILLLELKFNKLSKNK